MLDIAEIEKLLEPVGDKPYQRFVWDYIGNETRTVVYDMHHGGREVATFLNGIAAQMVCSDWNARHDNGERLYTLGTGVDGED